MTWRIDDPQSNEAAKIKYLIVPYTRGKGLDIGCGPFKAFPHFIGVDNLHHSAEFGWNMKPDVTVQDASKLELFATESMDFVFSSHTLEHIKDFKSALKEWWRVIKTGGHLVLYLPHKNFYPNIGEKGANPDHKNDFLPEDIVSAMKEIGGFDMLVNENRNTDNGPGQPGNEYSFLQVYRRRKDREHHFPCTKPRPKKLAACVRYGGFGDMIQSSSILPWLKSQGYAVHFWTTPRGWDIVKSDPHIDEVIVQDTDQVPNEELAAFWSAISKRYDKFINLSESVETTLLTQPGRTPRFWSKEARHKYMNHNYLEMTHLISSIPPPYRQKFYPTDEEKVWAHQERKKAGHPAFLYSLAGSSVHKVWPHLDTILARLLVTYPDCTIILTGDHLCQMLEAGWENEPRVWRRSGVWSIRQTLTFASLQADLVIGPETGVLNAVGLEDVPKIVTLSHSSDENLTKHWKSCIALTPKATPCYPCHMMHYSFADCVRDEATGTAACQADISPDVMWSAIQQLMRKAA